MEAPRRRSPARESRESEAVLMERICAKDVDAFEELYRNYRNRQARFLFKLVHRPQMVEEILNDTLMVVWDRAHAFNGESKLSTWISMSTSKTIRSIGSIRPALSGQALAWARPTRSTAVNHTT